MLTILNTDDMLSKNIARSILVCARLQKDML